MMSRHSTPTRHTGKLHIGQVMVPYRVQWSPDRSSIGLALDPSMELTVTAPPTATETDIEDTLDSRKEWILDTLSGLDEQQRSPAEKEYLSGEKLHYNGRRYRLFVDESTEVDTPGITLTDDGFQLRVPAELDGPRRQQCIGEAIRGWYTKRAREELIPRVRTLAAKVDVTPTDTVITDLAGRWGEEKEGVIRLHYRLLLAPTDIQNYVVVHELAHLRHSTHSERFWNTVGAVIPDYEDRREWLRINGNMLQF